MTPIQRNINIKQYSSVILLAVHTGIEPVISCYPSVLTN